MSASQFNPTIRLRNFCIVIENLKPSLKKLSLDFQKTLMRAKGRSKSARENFGKFIYQLQPKTKTLVRKLERILIKLYRQNLSSYRAIGLRSRVFANGPGDRVQSQVKSYQTNAIWSRLA